MIGLPIMKRPPQPQPFMSPKIERVCRTCQYWIYFCCHENSPALGREGNAAWPRTFENDSCGKWKFNWTPTEKDKQS